MATQKQRRRRAKEKRHDYDLVYIDEDGIEQPVERDDTVKKPPGRVGKGAASTAATKSQKTQPAGRAGRRGREVQPPSWRKVLKRGAIFAPIFFATVMLLGGSKMTIQAAIMQTVLLIGAFVPFSYFMDRVVWRQQQKRLTKS